MDLVGFFGFRVVFFSRGKLIKFWGIGWGDFGIGNWRKYFWGGLGLGLGF